MTEETLGSRIAAHRKRLGLTQDALAEQLGITAQAVSKWENDLSCPDISMLPRLAEIFGITVDALLGIASKTTLPAAAAVEEAPETPTGIPGRKTGVGIALWLLLTGCLILAAELFPGYLFRPGFWQTVGLTGLTVYGLFGIRPRFSVFRFGCGLLGGYYLYCALCCPSVMLNEELLLPLLLVFFGLGLLVDSIRGKKFPAGHFMVNGERKNVFAYSGNSFECSTCFGEDHRIISLPKLEGGQGTLFLGELSVDIHDCGSVTRDCCIALKCAFGTLTLYAPRTVRLQCINKTVFGSVQEWGSPVPEADTVIRVENDVCFGEINIKYV